MIKQLLKRITLIVMIGMLVCTVADAQTSKGTIMAGGSAGFDSYTPKGGSAQTTITIAPTAGLFLSDGFALGVMFDYTTIQNVGTNVSAGPFARYYVAGSKVFGNLGYTFASIKPDIGVTVKTGQLKIAAGYSAFLNDHVALEPAIYYASNSVEGNNAGSNIGLAIGFQIFLGN